ncbi:DUF6457 domain-containing protein [Actinospica robiniae]|uniref:DUF6457 domain-containing protein n=1 Tax=Actinospica robiniae TaxID=304901 RepID=UPI0003F713EF|nr:DUF6457 domain-containing protein [Actinospica robiniae]
MAEISGRPELNLNPDQQALVLDLAREAAHGVARPAAPLTTFLAGYALGAGPGLAGLSALVAQLSEAARSAEAARTE